MEFDTTSESATFETSAQTEESFVKKPLNIVRTDVWEQQCGEMTKLLEEIPGVFRDDDILTDLLMPLFEQKHFVSIPNILENPQKTEKDIVLNISSDDGCCESFPMEEICEQTYDQVDFGDFPQNQQYIDPQTDEFSEAPTGEFAGLPIFGVLYIPTFVVDESMF